MEQQEKQSDTLSTYFQNLNEVLKENIKIESNTSRLTELLDNICKSSEDFNKETVSVSMDDIFPSFLNQNCKPVATKAAKTIAEIAKTDKGREQCTTFVIVKKLLNIIRESDDVDLLTQAARDLGNICYFNEKGKDLVRTENGLKCILELLKKGLSIRDTEGADYLRDVAGGCLVTFLSEQEHLLPEAIELGLMSIICRVLEMENELADDAKIRALLMLGVLNDNNLQFLDTHLTKILLNIISKDKSLEVLEMCLEVLRGQGENEQVKLDLAKFGACELILDILEKLGNERANEETRLIMKYGSDLLVCITTGDDSMNLLYEDGKGKVYSRLMKWLEHENIDLQTVAVLATGNFARTDKHCECMVSQGIHKQLLSAMKKNDNQKSSIRLQHALLSALRNLVIPKSNKSVIINSGLIEVLHPMIDIPTFPVVFKLLGTLRIVIDGQEEAAIALGEKKDLIKKTVEWAGTKDHPGVEGEAQRLLAWLIMNSKNKEVTEILIEHDAIKYLVSMLTSEYVAMQNEALISLILTCVLNFNSIVEKQLIQTNIGETLCKFLNNNIAKLEPPIIRNILTLTETLIKSESVMNHLVESSWPTCLSQINTPEEEIISRVKNLETFFAPVHAA